MFARFLPRLRPRLIDRTFRISRPLDSTATPASSGFTATTGRSASERRVGTHCLRFPPLAGSLSRPWRPATPVAVSTLAFSRSVPEPQTRLTPPSRRAPPGQSSGTRQAHHKRTARPLAFDATSILLTTPQQRTPTRESRAGRFLERLPGPHLTRSTPPFPCRSPRRSSPNAAQSGLAPPPEERPRRPNNPPSPAQHRL